MALINGALQIGRSAITASQAGLQVVGNNMANAATPGYSRQRVTLSPTQYTEVVPGKYTGTGVAVTQIRRMVDEALSNRIRSAVSDSASSLIQQQAMDRVEAAFNELTDSDLSTQLSSFFEAWSNLQNNPADNTVRGNILLEGETLAGQIRELRSELYSIQGDLDSQVRSQVTQADSLVDQIAELNRQVVMSESGNSGSAAALRDQRDELLKQLSELVEIRTTEVEGGAVNVYIGNDPVIQYGDARGLSYIERQDANGTWLSQVIFTDNKQAISLTGGKVHGLITARDDQVGAAIGTLDDWAASLIHEVNTLHSMGSGLDGFTSLVSEFSVEDPTASLADMTSTDLKWAATNGVFCITITDPNGSKVTRNVQIEIGIDGSDTSLNDLVSTLNGADFTGISASINGAGRLEITADAGYTFGFEAPTDTDNYSNILAVLGMNTYFEGYNADTIGVRSDLDERHLVAGSNRSSTNGDIAGLISDLEATGLDSLNGLSLSDSYQSMVGQIANDSKAAQDNYIAAEVVLQTLENERQGISGVSIDEEAIHMIQYQRVFQGASRYINVINELLDDVMALAG